MMHFKQSLQTIKNELVKKEEILIHLQKNHPHLAHLSKKQILNYFNVQSLDALGGHIKEIKESQERQDTLTVQKNEVCSCRDGHGRIKDLYDSEVSAKAQIGKLSQGKRLQLSIYQCPYGSGWHLTKG
ncbi:hypothetical protein MN086_06565 [Sulfurovum sp. XGS-02]|uniref:hypothetical protein n=1 Tax=Sulfurovum sp. XGS-02 TaxID=2925411 RepID=UPI002059CD33|nr:hypothetical protein [Sulfurovum sp. XGS-02]UPT76714.1 hypothetical protein MN086_06565 [Sulfurovum sp. XGS-02]